MKAPADTVFDILNEGFIPLSTGDKKPSLRDAEQLRKTLSERFNSSENQRWFSPLTFSLSSDPSLSLTIGLPHELFFRWYATEGKELLESAVKDIFGNIAIHYIWPGGSAPEAEKSPASLFRGAHTSQSFEDFIPGGKNREVMQFFRRALHGSPCTILLHGTTGTGKSHLLHAAFEALNNSLPGNVHFFSAHDFIALFQHTPDRIHTELSPFAAVLLDDLQQLGHYPHLQTELSAFLDSRKNAFFIAACRSDEDSEGEPPLLPILYDRLCSGLSLRLEEPDLDVRLRFVQVSMERMGLPENRDTALLLARHCLRLRHISGVLEQVRLSYEQSHALPDAEKLSSLLRRAGAPQPVDSETILAVVASRYGYTSSQLCENTKDRKVTLARQTAMYLCRELLGESYPSLGRIFGGKDHSTVMYAIRKIEKLKVTNKDMNIQLTELTKQCIHGLQRRTK